MSQIVLQQGLQALWIFYYDATAKENLICRRQRGNCHRKGKDGLGIFPIPKGEISSFHTEEHGKKEKYGEKPFHFFHVLNPFGSSLHAILRIIHKMALSFFVNVCYNSAKCGHYSLMGFLFPEMDLPDCLRCDL